LDIGSVHVYFRHLFFCTENKGNAAENNLFLAGKPYFRWSFAVESDPDSVVLPNFVSLTCKKARSVLDIKYAPSVSVRVIFLFPTALGLGYLYIHFRDKYLAKYRQNFKLPSHALEMIHEIDKNNSIFLGSREGHYKKMFVMSIKL
jgi:hypothetical protein